MQIAAAEQENRVLWEKLRGFERGLKVQAENFQRERDELAATVSIVVSERDRFVASVLKIGQEQESLAKQLATISRERDELA